MGFLVASDEADSTEIEMHAVSPDGRDYSISSFTSVGIAGPPFLGVEAGAPRWARSLAKLVNRGLGQLPRKPTEEPLTILYVFDGQGRQVCVIWTTGRAEAERKAIEVVAEIQAGSFDPSAYDTGPG